MLKYFLEKSKAESFAILPYNQAYNHVRRSVKFVLIPRLKRQLMYTKIIKTQTTQINLKALKLQLQLVSTFKTTQSCKSNSFTLFHKYWSSIQNRLTGKIARLTINNPYEHTCALFCETGYIIFWFFAGFDFLYLFVMRIH